jgi:hypothetical protein
LGETRSGTLRTEDGVDDLRTTCHPRLCRASIYLRTLPEEIFPAVETKQLVMRATISEGAGIEGALRNLRRKRWHQTKW